MKYIHVFVCDNCGATQTVFSDEMLKPGRWMLTEPHSGSSNHGTTNFHCGKFIYRETYLKVNPNG